MIDSKKITILWIKHCQVTLLSVGNKVFLRQFDSIFFISSSQSTRRGTVFSREEIGKGRNKNASNLKKDFSESVWVRD